MAWGTVPSFFRLMSSPVSDLYLTRGAVDRSGLDLAAGHRALAQLLGSDAVGREPRSRVAGAAQRDDQSDHRDDQRRGWDAPYAPSTGIASLHPSSSALYRTTRRPIGTMLASNVLDGWLSAGHCRPSRRLPMATRPRLTEVERWERETFSRAPERDAPFSTMSGEPIQPLYTEADLPGIGGSDDPWVAGGVSVYARRVRLDVSGAVVDDASVRRVRDGGGDERAVPVSARSWPDGALDGVRHAVADGPRLGPSAVAGGGGSRGGGGRHACRIWRRCSPGSRSIG